MFQIKEGYRIMATKCSICSWLDPVLNEVGLRENAIKGIIMSTDKIGTGLVDWIKVLYV